MRATSHMTPAVPREPADSTHASRAESARSRSSELPPHQYARSWRTQHSTHGSSGQSEQPSVVNGCGGVNASPRRAWHSASACAASSPARSESAEYAARVDALTRSEEHTSELPSLRHVVCRLLHA